MVSLRAPRPVRVKSLWRERERVEERERRKRDGGMGREAGKGLGNNRREEGGRLSCSSHSFSISAYFSPNPLQQSSEYQFYIPLLI